MSIGFAGHTKTFSLEAHAPTMVASRNLHRKGMYLANHSDQSVKVAVGLAPAPEDFFSLGPYKHIKFDHMCPVAPIWAKGAGVLVVGEVS